MFSGIPSRPPMNNGLQIMRACEGDSCKKVTCKWVCKAKPIPMESVPRCEPARCRIQCEPPKTPNCAIQSSRPVCKTECKYNKKTNCYKCSNVCQPLKTRLKCVADKPKCSVKCDPPKCEREHLLPKTAPKPICKLVCPKSIGNHVVANFDDNYYYQS